MNTIPIGDPRWLDAALRIGKALCAEAIWYEDRCTFIGRSQDEADEQTLIITPTAESLGSELYGGTSGVSLFLAHLAARTGDASVRRTALGAIRHALHRPLPRAAHPIGFYSGSLGIAFVATQVGQLLSVPEIAEAGLALAAQTADKLTVSSQEATPLDIISGAAGGILAFLTIARSAGSDSRAEKLHRAAIWLGENLCQRAERSTDGQWLWRGTAMSDPNQSQQGVALPMTGYSHGQAGIALALLELYAVSAQQQFLDGFLGAVAFESHWFNPSRMNWPDLRSVAEGTDPASLTVFGTTWCHGAPGILLSRLRAQTLMPSLAGMLAADIAAGIKTTSQALDARRTGPRQDGTLCHGGAGFGDILLTCGLLLSQESLVQQAERVGTELLSEELPGARYHTGTPSGGPNPSLLVGTAGIGLFYLRLHAPQKIPSVLVPPHGVGST